MNETASLVRSAPSAARPAKTPAAPPIQVAAPPPEPATQATTATVVVNRSRDDDRDRAGLPDQPARLLHARRRRRLLPRSGGRRADAAAAHLSAAQASAVVSQLGAGAPLVFVSYVPRR